MLSLCDGIFKFLMSFLISLLSFVEGSVGCVWVKDLRRQY